MTAEDLMKKYHYGYKHSIELLSDKFVKDLMQENKRLQDRDEILEELVENLERQIKIKDKWCHLIISLGFDYDGFNKSKDLKKLIDELVRYANCSIDADDKTIVYTGMGENCNILLEPIENRSDKNEARGC